MGHRDKINMLNNIKTNVIVVKITIKKIFEDGMLPTPITLAMTMMLRTRAANTTNPNQAVQQECNTIKPDSKRFSWLVLLDTKRTYRAFGRFWNFDFSWWGENCHFTHLSSFELIPK